MIRIHEELEPYVDFSNVEDNTLVTHDLPNDLKPAFEKFKAAYEKMQKDELTDY